MTVAAAGCDGCNRDGLCLCFTRARRPEARNVLSQALSIKGPKENVVLIAIIAILLVVAGGLALTIKFESVPLSPLEQTIANLRATPLIGQAIKDNPDAEKAIRTAMAEDQREPVAPGVPPRAFYAVGAVSRDYIRPMLAAADDASVIAVMAARFALAQRLRGDDPQACRDFAMNGVQRVDRLTPEGQKLFSDFLLKMETAYRSGRSAGGKPQPMLAPPEVVQLLGQTGFTNDDFEALNRYAALPSLRACDIDLKIDGAVPKLPADKQGAFGRFVRTH
jgi:hypothetical protein